MTARLFRRNKLILSFLFFFVAAFFIGRSIATAQNADKNSLDYKYDGYINNFTTSNDGTTTSGLSGGTVQNATSNNDAVGLVFTVNLGINTASVNGDTIKSHWNRVYVDTNGFLIKLCLNGSSTQCWLSPIANKITQVSPDDAINQHNIYEQFNGDYIDAEHLTVTAFSKNETDTAFQNIYSYNPATNTTNTASSLTLVKGSNLTATLWYCGASNNDSIKAVEDYKNNGITPTNPTKFGDLCNDGSYFQIGSPLPITIPADSAALQQQTSTSQQALTTKLSTSSSDSDNLPKCGLIPGSPGTINGCLAQVAYGIYYVVAWIAALFGKLFDFFIGYSLSDTSYRYGFAVTGWKLVRDISNIFFILIMVWTGFSAVFDTEKTSMKSVVPNLIINALLINFSLFATRLVIDISNVTARIFYSQMVVCDQVNIDPTTGTCSPAQAKRGLGGYWPLSEKIVGSFNPQKMFTANVLNQPTYGQTATPTTTPERDAANYFAVVSLVGAFIMVAITAMFFKVTFLFLARVIGLYICMIFSPFAFLSRDIPMLGGIARLRWGDWKKELTSYAIMAPIFVFFLYIIYVFLSSNFVQQIGVADTSGSFFGTVLSIVIPMLLVYFLIDQAQKQASKFAGEIGQTVQNIGSTVVGLGAGVATGGTALLAGRIIGGAAKRLDESRFGIGVRNLAARNGALGWTGRKLQQGLNATRSASFDIRQSTLGKKYLSTVGINADQKGLNLLSGVGLGLGTDQRKGGFDADVKRRQEDQEKDAKLLEEKAGEAIKAFNEKNKKKYDKNVTDVVETAMVAQYGQTAVTAAKNDPDKTVYNNYRNTVLQNNGVQNTINNIAKPQQIRSADELTRTRRKEYAEGLKKGNIDNRALTWLGSQGAVGKVLAGALGGTIGATIGTEVRGDGDKKAAKKIEEKSKADKALQDIEETLKKGFQDLISVEMYQRNYDQLSVPEEKASVDAKQAAINVDKTERERWEKRVQAVEQTRYGDLKPMRARAKALKTAMLANGTQTNINAYFDALDEIEQAVKHQKIWSDIAKYQEEQKKKLKDE